MLRVKPAAMAGAKSLSIKVLGMASRHAASGAQLRVMRRAAKISWAVMASRTLRVRAQAVSRVLDSGRVPCSGTRLAVDLNPTNPLSAAGMRIEPPVSDPSPSQALPLATEAAAPEEEPPGTYTSPKSRPHKASMAAGVG